MLLEKLPRAFINFGSEVVIVVIVPRHFRNFYRKAFGLECGSSAANFRDRKVRIVGTDPNGDGNLALRGRDYRVFILVTPGSGVNSRGCKIFRLNHGKRQRVDGSGRMTKEIYAPRVDWVLRLEMFYEVSQEVRRIID